MSAVSPPADLGVHDFRLYYFFTTSSAVCSARTFQLLNAGTDLDCVRFHVEPRLQPLVPHSCVYFREGRITRNYIAARSSRLRGLRMTTDFSSTDQQIFEIFDSADLGADKKHRAAACRSA